MLTMGERLFTAGQFAKLHGINKRTLMYYDDIGLLPAARRGENGYRYYCYAQSTTLEVLLSLRELDVSIAEIQQYMARRSPQALESLLEEKIQEAEEKIRRLQNVRSLLSRKRELLLRAQRVAIGEVAVVERPRTVLCLSRPIRGVSEREEMKILLEHIDGWHNHCLYNHTMGSMIAVPALLSGNLSEYDYYFTELDDELPGASYRPAGRYLCCYHRGEWESLPQAYSAMLAYAARHGLGLSGYAYETGVLDEMAIRSMAEYITEILISIAP